MSDPDGDTEVITAKDAIKQHWTASARGWFPKGSEDPEIALLKVTIREAEYWDAPNGEAVVLFAYAKAMLTGQKPGNIGEHERLELREVASHGGGSPRPSISVDTGSEVTGASSLSKSVCDGEALDSRLMILTAANATASARGRCRKSIDGALQSA